MTRKECQHWTLTGKALLYFSLKRVTAKQLCERSAACSEFPSFIVLPKSGDDVSIVLKVVQSLRITFFIRSGGHSPNPGWSSTGQPGLVIDLKNLNQITVSEDKQIVSLGPGALWGDVYTALDSSGISVIGGRIPSVGVGGLILGGASDFMTTYDSEN